MPTEWTKMMSNEVLGGWTGRRVLPTIHPQEGYQERVSGEARLHFPSDFYRLASSESYAPAPSRSITALPPTSLSLLRNIESKLLSREQI